MNGESNDLVEYKKYLEEKNPQSSGKVSIYLAVIKKIGKILQKVPGFEYIPNDFSSIKNFDVLWRSYVFVKEEQEKQDGGIFKDSDLTKSYWDSRHGFCSAAIRSFLNFRIETYDVMANVPKMGTEIAVGNQKPIPDFEDFIKKFAAAAESAGLSYDLNLVKRFVCALLAKPFVVLTGLSGSGKTKLADAFTTWIGVENTVRIVPVGADWTNNEKLLGYPNALDSEQYVLPDTGVLKLMLDAQEHPELPFFLILDEMNLSHVERYFADFLSAMESEDEIKLYDGQQRYADDGTPVPQKLKFPKNLFVIGTMNVDETTYMFSPKVLDRAQVIEFRVSKDDMAAFLSAPGNPRIDDLAGKGAAYAKAFLDLAAERKTKQPTGDELTKVKEALAAVFPSLAELGAEFGYRSAIEILTFVAYYLEASGYKKLTGTPQKDCLKAAIDAGMLQKLLPKLHGSLNRLGPVVDALLGKVSKTKSQANDPEAPAEIEKLYPLTYEKLLRMKDRVEKNGFTSFAEA